MNKRITALLSALILTLSVTGCNSVSETKDNKDNTVKRSEITEEKKTTAEAVSDMPDIEPIPIPKGGWTEETIQDVIFINGKNVRLPCKFEEFGDGFELSVDEYTNFHKDKNYAFVNYKYDDVMIGGMNIDNCDNENDLQNGQVIYLWCSTDYLEDGSDNRVPIYINGVTLGSSKEEIENNLGIEMTEVTKGSDYSGSIRVGNYSISLIIEKNTLNTMTIAYNNF